MLRGCYLPTMKYRTPLLKQTLKAVGGVRPLARELGIKHSGVSVWPSVPPKWAMEVAAIASRCGMAISAGAYLIDTQEYRQRAKAERLHAG